MNRPLAIGANRIRVCARIEQRIHHREMAAHRRVVQRRFARIVAGPGQARIARQFLPYAREVTATRGIQKTRDAFRDGKLARQDLEQELRDLMVLAVLRHGQRAMSWNGYVR